MCVTERSRFHAADAKGRAALVEAMSKPERDRIASHPALHRLPSHQTAEYVCVLYVSRRNDRNSRLQRQLVQRDFPACTHPEHHGLTAWQSYDAIVVGSGACGGWAAMELAKAGMKVLMLEAGSPSMQQGFPSHVPVSDGLSRSGQAGVDAPLHR